MSDKAQGVNVEFVRSFVQICSIRRQCFTRGAPRDVRGGIALLSTETGQGCARVQGRKMSKRQNVTPPRPYTHTHTKHTLTHTDLHKP